MMKRWQNRLLHEKIEFCFLAEGRFECTGAQCANCPGQRQCCRPRLPAAILFNRDQTTITTSAQVTFTHSSADGARRNQYCINKRWRLDKAESQTVAGGEYQRIVWRKCLRD